MRRLTLSLLFVAAFALSAVAEEPCCWASARRSLSAGVLSPTVDRRGCRLIRCSEAVGRTRTLSARTVSQMVSRFRPVLPV